MFSRGTIDSPSCDGRVAYRTRREGRAPSRPFGVRTRRGASLPWCVRTRRGASLQWCVLVKIGERSGIGLSNLFGVWEQSGYARPTITESFDPERTRVDVEIEVSGKSTEKRGEYTGKSTEKRGEYTEKSTERNVALTETEEKIVAILVSNGYATQKSISIKLGITRTYVTKIMGELQSKGVICRVGPDKGGHWEVVKKGRMP